MKLRKSSIIGIAAASSAFVCLGVFLLRGNIFGSQAKPDYNEIINEFNKEHGTSYQIATDEQLSLIGVTPDERDAFIGSMSADEFKEYLTEIHNNANDVGSGTEPGSGEKREFKEIKSRRVDDLNEKE